MKDTENKIAAILIGTFICSMVIISCSKDEDTSNKAGGSGCPTTAACGCSAYTKSECEANTTCCKWTVGQGCGCR